MSMFTASCGGPRPGVTHDNVLTDSCENDSYPTCVTSLARESCDSSVEHKGGMCQTTGLLHRLKCLPQGWVHHRGLNTTKKFDLTLNVLNIVCMEDNIFFFNSWLV